MDENSSVLSLTFELPAGRERARATRVRRFESLTRLLVALALPPQFINQCLGRLSTRRDGSTPARVLLERVVDNLGTVRYILQRHASTGRVDVATRASEVFFPSRRRFKDPLTCATVTQSDCPEVPTLCPAFLRWRPSAVSDVLGFDGSRMCGRVTLSVPCCVVETGVEEVMGLVEGGGQA